MKLSCLILGLVATGLSVAPAFAQQPESPVPYRISMVSDVKPASHGALVYPAAASTRGISGACVVQLDVAPDGSAKLVEVSSCTSKVFRKEAARIASNLEFGAATPDRVAVEIRWDFDAG
jgi:TonB family protein